MAAPAAKRPAPGSTALPLCFALLLTLAAALLLSFISGYPHPATPPRTNPNPPPPRPRSPIVAPPPAPSPRAPPTKPCPHLILISAARHGSTWLVDSATSCLYSAGLDGTYLQDVFRRTEIWTDRPGPVADITPPRALAYIRANSSVKFMQTTLRKYPDRAQALLRLANHARIPVLILRRRAAEAFRSRKEAHDRGDWRATNYTPGSERQREQLKLDEEREAQLENFADSLDKHFRIAEQLIDRAGNTLVDRFDYDDIKDQPRIVAENSGCYIVNCNFVQDQ